jgi:hypothetical protein
MTSSDSRHLRSIRDAGGFFEWLTPRSPARQRQDSEQRTRGHHHNPRQGSSHKIDQPESQLARSTISWARPKRPSPRQPGGKPKKVEFELKALDGRYLDISFTVTSGFPMVSLVPFIRNRYENRHQPLAETSVFQFYGSNGQRLSQDETITSKTRRVWYRVVKSRKDLEGWKISHWGDRTDGPVESHLSREMADAISAGDTVGQMREKIARHMGIPDANRVILIARDGLRRGSLLGNDWKVCQVKTWLCRWLSVDVNPENRYVVLRGLRREYVYHPKPESATMDLKALLDYMDSRLFRGAHQHGYSESSTPCEHASLSLDGRHLRGSEFVKWGATYDFEVSDDVADGFSREESWLLPATEMCGLLMENRSIGELAIKITSSCQHRPTVCRDCLTHWITENIQEGKWDEIRCPECRQILEYNDVKRNTPKDLFDRYDKLLLRGALNHLDGFRFCLSPTCESGQMHDPQCPEFECIACKARHCLRHNLPGHTGRACEQYDMRNPHQLDEEATGVEMSRTSNTCPNCNTVIHKFEGCNHITCESSRFPP